MNKDSIYMSSMIVVPKKVEPEFYDWRYLKQEESNVVSYSAKDPFHYAESTVYLLSSFRTGFEVIDIHNYGHPFQKLVECKRI